MKGKNNMRNKTEIKLIGSVREIMAAIQVLRKYSYKNIIQGKGAYGTKRPDGYFKFIGFRNTSKDEINLMSDEEIIDRIEDAQLVLNCDGPYCTYTLGNGAVDDILMDLGKAIGNGKFYWSSQSHDSHLSEVFEIDYKQKLLNTRSIIWDKEDIEGAFRKYVKNRMTFKDFLNVLGRMGKRQRHFRKHAGYGNHFNEEKKILMTNVRCVDKVLEDQHKDHISESNYTYVLCQAIGHKKDINDDSYNKLVEALKVYDINWDRFLKSQEMETTLNRLKIESITDIETGRKFNVNI